MTRSKSAPTAPRIDAPAPPRWCFYLSVMIVLLGVCIAHWPVLSAGAIYIDDDQYFVDNPLVRAPGWTSAGRFLGEVLEPSTVEGYYQPLTMISLMLDAASGATADHLRPFHVTSLLLHLANVALIMILLRSLFDDWLAAAAVGLLFGLHPSTVEPIAWVSDRKSLLATFFALISLLLYVRRVRTLGRGVYVLSIVAFVLALMSKPTVLMLPLMLVLLDWWPLKRLSIRSIIDKAPFLAVAIAFGIITFISQDRTGSATMPTAYGPQRIPLTLAHNIVLYLQMMIWPASASAHHPFPAPISLSNSAVLRGVIGTAILLLGLVVSLRWTRALAVGWLIFFVAILPTMQIIGFTDVIASDKYVYWPVIGILLAVAWLFTRLAPPSKRNRRVGLAACILAMACTEGFVTQRTLAAWRTTESLCQYQIGIDPNDATVRTYYAVYLSKQPNRSADAIRQCEAADLAGIKNELDCTNLGTALIRIGRSDLAQSLYERSLPVFGQSYSVLSNLGYVWMEQGRFAEAAGLFQRAIAIRPGRAEPHTNLANAHLNEGKLEEAIAEYRASLAIRNDIPETHNNLGVALMQLDHNDEAMHEFDAAIKYRTQYPDSHRNKALLLASQNRLAEAMTACREALGLEPNNALNHTLMGDLLMSSGRPAEARVAYQNALRLSPGLPGAERGLAGAEARMAAPQPAGTP